MSGEVSVRFGDFAELVGYSLPATEVTSAQPLSLILYWRGLGGISPADYLVFTHLLAEDGHLVAQHDGAPANSARPMSTWENGELVTDPHAVAFQDAGYVGPARLVVGLYDPSTGRVTTHTGSDSVVLPVVITILPP
jgi:hypothetical protein